MIFNVSYCLAAYEQRYKLNVIGVCWWKVSIAIVGVVIVVIPVWAP